MTRITRIIITVTVGTTATVALLATPATAEAKNPFGGACDGGPFSQVLYILDMEIGQNGQYWDDECSYAELREYNDY